MHYESTDYNRRQEAAARNAGGGLAGDPRHPMDVTTSRSSGKGLLIAAIVILGFIALIVLLPSGGDPDAVAPGLESGTTQSIPSDGTAGGVDPSTTPAAPAQGE